jgi:hypothetical protein
MKKARPVKQKVMGRPRTGTTPLMGFRADPVIRASIVRWAENQPDMPSLSEAIRRLVELGLAGGARPAGRSEKTAVKAKELAGAQIDRMVDKSAPVEEQASRKRRLLKGPEEFREIRVDRAKKKGSS